MLSVSHVIVTFVDEMEVDAEQKRSRHGRSQQVQRPSLLFGNVKKWQDNERSNDDHAPDEVVLPELQFDVQCPMSSPVHHYDSEVHENDHARMQVEMLHERIFL